MFSFLKNHPFAVQAFFKSSTVLTFAVTKSQLQALLPPCLTLDEFNGYGFIAMAMVKTTALRPKGFPKFLGNNFYLIGYRIFVRYINENGKSLRGLYIIKSETDKKKMEWLGNIFTKYSYITTDITEAINDEVITIVSKRSDFEISFKVGNENSALPQDSLFKDFKEARRFAGPLPFTFSYNSTTKQVLIIEGVREKWIPKPVEVISHNISFIKNLGFTNIKLANAFVVNNIPYYWKKGKKEKWKG